MNILIDTNIFLDYIFKRKHWQHAQKLFIDTISCKHKIFYCEEILFEINKQKIDQNLKNSLFDELNS